MLYPAIAVGCAGYVKIGNALTEPLGGGGLRQRDGLVHTDVLFAGMANAAVLESMKAMFPEEEKPEEHEETLLILYKAKSQTSVNLKGDNTMKELQKQIEKTKKGSLEYCIGQMLLSRCEGDPAAEEIVEKDLATKGMELTACAKSCLIMPGRISRTTATAWRMRRPRKSSSSFMGLDRRNPLRRNRKNRWRQKLCRQTGSCFLWKICCRRDSHAIGRKKRVDEASL